MARPRNTKLIAGFMGIQHGLARSRTKLKFIPVKPGKDCTTMMR